MFLYILTFEYLDSRREDRRLWTEWQQAFSEFRREVLYSILIEFGIPRKLVGLILGFLLLRCFSTFKWLTTVPKYF
jgi:hypothetical protein